MSNDLNEPREMELYDEWAQLVLDTALTTSEGRQAIGTVFMSEVDSLQSLAGIINHQSLNDYLYDHDDESPDAKADRAVAAFRNGDTDENGNHK